MACHVHMVHVQPEVWQDLKSRGRAFREENLRQTASSGILNIQSAD